MVPVSEGDRSKCYPEGTMLTEASAEVNIVPEGWHFDRSPDEKGHHFLCHTKLLLISISSMGQSYYEQITHPLALTMQRLLSFLTSAPRADVICSIDESMTSRRYVMTAKTCFARTDFWVKFAFPNAQTSHSADDSSVNPKLHVWKCGRSNTW